jgi:hypothetical protein
MRQVKYTAMYLLSVAMVMLSMYPLFCFVSKDINFTHWSIVLKCVFVLAEIYIIKTGIAVYKEEV